jgi:hypothetical protein
MGDVIRVQERTMLVNHMLLPSSHNVENNSISRRREASLEQCSPFELVSTVVYCEQ